MISWQRSSILPSRRSLQNSSCAILAAATISSPARRKRFACRIFARGFWAGSASSSMTAFFPGDYFFIRPPNAPQNSCVFLASSSMKRSARCMYRCARSWAAVIRTDSTGSGAGAVCGGSAFGGSWRSGGGGPGAGTLFGGLALFLLPGGRPLRLGAVSGTAAAAGAGAGSGAGSTGAGAGSAGSAGSGSGTASTFSSISFLERY